MGWDNAGGYNRQHNFSADASSGIKILALRVDQELDDFASAMTVAWARNGQNVPTADVPMGGKKFINVAAATSISNYMRVKEFIENVPIFMQDQETSADRISVSAQYFTSVSANQAPTDGTRIFVRANSTKSSAPIYLNGHSANIKYQDGNPANAVMVSGGIYELIYSSVETSWKIQNPDIGRTAAEIAAGVTPINYGYPPGDVERYGGAADSGTTDNITALQNALSANAGDRPVRIRRGSGYYKVSGRVTAPANTHIIMEDGAELRWTATTATGTSLLGNATRPGIEVTGSNFRLDGNGKITGPSVATYVQNEIGIFSKATSTNARYEKFFISPQIEFTQWGYAALVLQFWDRITIDGFTANGCGHAGCFMFSCNYGSALDVNVGNITPGVGGQGYGFALIHDSVGYNVDPDLATPRKVANPFCQGWEVSGTVYDVPIWEGFDAHGGYELNFHDCRTYNCRYGMNISNGSGDAANYAGENLRIDNVVCTTARRDGSATTIATFDGIGICINGGATVKHRNVHLSNFTTIGYGDTTGAGMSVSAKNCFGSISNGRVLTWKGYGVYSYDGDIQVDGVTFGAVANATNSICVFADFSATAAEVDVSRCKILLEGGTAPNEGLRIASGNNRAVLMGNDFTPATTPYAGSANGFLTKGLSDIRPQINVTGTPTSVSLAAAAGAPIVGVCFNVSGNHTVSDFTGFIVGQIAECYFPIAAATAVTTIDRTNGNLAGGANFVSTQYDTLVIEFVSTSAPKFVERSRSANS